MFNPEYGERLGTHTKLEITYKRIGDFLKRNALTIAVMFLQATRIWLKNRFKSQP